MSLSRNRTVRRISVDARRHRLEAGYSMIELMIGVAILTLVSGTVMSGVQRLTRVTETTSNRSEMHSGVRNATEFATGDWTGWPHRVSRYQGPRRSGGRGRDGHGRCHVLPVNAGSVRSLSEREDRGGRRHQRQSRARLHQCQPM